MPASSWQSHISLKGAPFPEHGEFAMAEHQEGGIVHAGLVVLQVAVDILRQTGSA